MNDSERARIQRDARRTAAGRRIPSTSDPSQAIIRQLGVELYKERHRTEHAPDKPDDHEQSDQKETKGSADR